MTEKSDLTKFAPGSFGCHEALHMTSFLASAVHDELCTHQAVELRPEWKEIADKAYDALAALYQAIGKEHL